MINKSKRKFINKKIFFGLNDREFSDLPKIIRSNEIEEIHQVREMINISKSDLENKINKEMEVIEKNKIEVNRRAEEEIMSKTVEYFNDFQSYRDEYFNNLESHCEAILKRSIDVILDGVNDDQRFQSALNLAMNEVKEKSNVVLKINPAHESSTSDIKLELGWDIKVDKNFSLDECQIDVPLGGYRSNFKYSVEMLFGAIEKSDFDNE